MSIELRDSSKEVLAHSAIVAELVDLKYASSECYSGIKHGDLEYESSECLMSIEPKDPRSKT